MRKPSRMPAKKGGKKPTPKKSGTPRTVEPMPSVIFHEETYAKAPDEASTPAHDIFPAETLSYHQVPPRRATYNTSARNWMWTGVIVLASIIFFLWGWALKNQVSMVNWNTTNEAQLYQNTRANWDAIFNKNNTALDDLSTNKDEIRSMLAQLVAASVSSTTSTVTNATTTHK